MKTVDFFPAKWLSSNGKYPSPMFRKTFKVHDIKTATLLVGCFGMYEGYINSTPITDDLFGTLNTDFHKRGPIDYCGIPFTEETGHRIYCSEYDVTDLLCDGKNTLAFLTGSGWYEINHNSGFGICKLCYRLTIVHNDENKTVIFSDEQTKIRESYIEDYSIMTGETLNFLKYPNGWTKNSFDDHNWENSYIEDAPDTNYLLADCPPDKIIRKITPKLIFKSDEKCIYDAGEIFSGYPIVFSKEGVKETIKIRFSELLDKNGLLNEEKTYNQQITFITDAARREMHTKFTWFCFRYFEVCGNCDIGYCLVVHSDVTINSDFDCDNDVLNWYYNAFLKTQLANMHCGIPSDCPHIERRGYTGDGQLVCNAAMSYLDVQKFYKKWIYDISDCQDRQSGHVQYTAPFFPCGGGPGGWGCAIVNVPFEYYRHYKDERILSDLYPQMLKYFEYLENHSENNLVISDRKNAWCLGDWCTPEQVRLNLFDGVKIPAPFVNTYFYIKSMKQVLEIAEILKINDDTDMLKERIDAKISAIYDNYFDSSNGNFCKNIQGANAFAIDLGLGDKRTLDNMINHYRKTGHFDTGIFGTDIVTRVLFEKGYPDIAIMLLTSTHTISFYNEMKLGATTLLEYWTGERSQCHPMFGAACAYLAEYVLGIYTPRSIKEDKIIIRPTAMEQIKKAKGYITTRYGKIKIEYDENFATVTLPAGLNVDIDIKNRDVKVQYI